MLQDLIHMQTLRTDSKPGMEVQACDHCVQEPEAGTEKTEERWPKRSSFY